jgi:hypothetical protein
MIHRYQVEIHSYSSCFWSRNDLEHLSASERQEIWPKWSIPESIWRSQLKSSSVNEILDLTRGSAGFSLSLIRITNRILFSHDTIIFKMNKILSLTLTGCFIIPLRNGFTEISRTRATIKSRKVESDYSMKRFGESASEIDKLDIPSHQCLW